MEDIMEELYLETKNGNVLIEQRQIEKYNLKQGMLTPFTHYRVVDKNGVFFSKKRIKKDKTDTDVSEMQEGEGLEDDEIVEFPGGEIYSTSEIIDISQGTDSSVEGIQ